MENVPDEVAHRWSTFAERVFSGPKPKQQLARLREFVEFSTEAVLGDAVQYPGGDRPPADALGRTASRFLGEAVDCSTLPPRRLVASVQPASDFFPLIDPSAFTVDAKASCNILWVHQGEYGFALSANNSNADANAVCDEAASACTPKSRRTIIASTDATTCVVLAVRGVLCGSGGSTPRAVVAMVHLDHDDDELVGVLENMVRGMVVPALLRCANPGEDITAARLGWYLVGGTVDDRYSLPILATVMHYFAARLPKTCVVGNQTVALKHHFIQDGLCVWKMNTSIQTSDDAGSLRGRAPGDKSPMRCCVWGIQIDCQTGACAPCVIAPGSRSIPGFALRLAQNVGYRPISPLAASYSRVPPPFNASIVRFLLSPVDALASRALDMAHDATPGGTVVEESFGDFVQHWLAWCAEATHSRWPPAVVPHFMWRRTDARDPRGVSDADLLKFSTTPDCEPSDFAYCLRRSWMFQRLIGPEMVFGTNAGVGLAVQ